VERGGQRTVLGLLGDALDHRLVTWGPYRYVRHPSYSGYFLMFMGLALTVNNPLVLAPILAVAGYARLVDTEERLLVAVSAMSTGATRRLRAGSRPGFDDPHDLPEA